MRHRNDDHSTYTTEGGLTYRVGPAAEAMRWLQEEHFAAAKQEQFATVLSPPLVPCDEVIGDNMRPLRRKDVHRVVQGVLAGKSGPIPVISRYESTGPIAKFVAATKPQMPFRGAYADVQVRVEPHEDLDGKRRFLNFTQLGVETFADSEPGHRDNTARALAVAVRLVESLGLADQMRIRIAHASIDRRLRSSGAHPGAVCELRGALEAGDKRRLERLTRELFFPRWLVDFAHRMMGTRNVGIEQGIELMREVDETASCVSDVEHVLSLRDRLGASGAQVVWDSSVCRSLNFYQGLTLQIDLGDELEVAGGGDYTGLSKAYGGDLLMSFGWAFGAERVLRAMAAAAVGMEVDK